MTGIDRDTMARENRRISIRLELRANQILEGLELTAGQAYVLLFLIRRRDQGASLTDVHRAMDISMAALSGLLKRLREKDYVRTERRVDDDRYKLFFPTDRGLTLQDELEKRLRTVEDTLYRSFTREELATLDRLQKKMLHNLCPRDQLSMKEEMKA